MLSTDALSDAPQVKTWWSRSRLADDPAWRRDVVLVLGALLILDVIMAVQSAGFFHPDEHYQIIEFANLKLGGIRAEELPWEYPARIRPWLQPALFYAGGLALHAVGVTDPFTMALCFRLASVLVGGLGAFALALALGAWLSDRHERTLALASSTLLFWTPFIHARTSSENFSGAFVLVALSILALEGAPGLSAQEAPGPGAREPGTGRRWSLTSALAAGAAFGLAFCFRYQTALLAVGAWAWALFVPRAGLRWGFAFIAGALVWVGLGVLVDAWGYGELTFAPWNYVKENLVAGRAASFGVRPFWAYVGLLWHDLPKPFAFGVILAPVLALVFARRHLLTWAGLPFLLVHAALAHKEMRFLFPWLLFAPALLVIALSGRLQRLWARPRRFAAALAVLGAYNAWLFVFDGLRTEHGAWLETTMARAARDRAPLFYRGELGAVNLFPRFYTRDIAYGPATDDEIRSRLARGERPFRYLRPMSDPPPVELSTACAPIAYDPPQLAWLPEVARTEPGLQRLFGTRRPTAVWECEAVGLHSER